MSFWKDKRVLVLGSAGFVGRTLVPMLQFTGARVSMLDNFSRTDMNPVTISSIGPPDISFGNCSHKGTCYDHFKDKDVIINLAATVAGVIYNQSHHVEMFTGNYAVQAMPLEVASEYGIERFLTVSSVCVYAPGHNAPCIEHSGFIGLPTPANEGYAYAKRMGEQLSSWYANEKDLNVTIVRPSNIFGPGDYFDELAHVVPALMKKAIEDDVIVVNGTGYEQREFLYVEDAARGMMAAVEHGRLGEVYNLGTNGETLLTIRELVEEIKLVTNTLDKPHRFQQGYHSGDNVRWSDASKANSELHWQYQVGIREGLERTYEWYLENR